MAGRLAGVILSAALALPGIAHSAFFGKPPIDRFDITLPVFPRHFAIDQTDDGLVYVGSADGMLVFDGERWSLLPTNGQIVRSLAVDGTRVYVGGYDSYGYIDRDAYGRQTYVDLSKERAADAAPDGFADIWRVVRTRDGVFFVALRDTFSFDPDSRAQRHVSHAGRFGAIAQCGDDTWLQFRGEGFRRWQDGAWQPLAHTASLGQLIAILLPDRAGTCLAFGAGSGLHRISANSIEELPLPARLNRDFVHAGTRLPDGALAFSTAIGQAYVLSADLQRLHNFPVHPGFLSDIVYRNGEVLVAATTAVYRFAWPSTFSALTSMDAGRPSFNGASVTAAGALLFSDADLWRLGSDADGAAQLEPLKFSSNATYDWLPAGRLPAVLAESHALVQMAPARQVIDPATYPRLLRPDRYRDDSVFVGTEHGLRQLRGDREWRLLPDASAPKNRLVNSLAQIDAHSVWIGTPDDGVWRFELNADGNLGDSRRVPLPGSGEGPAYVETDGERLIVSSTEAVHVWDGDEFAIEPGYAPLLALRARQEPLGFVAEPVSGRRWAFSTTELFVDDDGWRQIPFRHPGIGPIIDVQPIGPGTLLIVGSDGVMQYQDAIEAPIDPRINLRMTAVSLIDATGTGHRLPLAPTDRVVLAPDDLGVKFEFALSGLRRPGSTLYRGRLLPYEREFSDWSASAGYTYTRLRPGHYELEVEARDELGSVFRMPHYRIAFSAKWHERSVVRIAIGTLGVLGFSALGWLLYRRRTQVLRRLVAERTQELALANRKLDAMAHHDALTQLPNRRRFDEYLDAVWTACSLQRRPLALLVIDVDHFKAYNDRHGHAAGDALLQSLAQVLSSSLRRSEDLTARYGGEEFVVVMPGADNAAALAAAEQLRLAVNRANLGVSVSIGVASQLPSDGGSRSGLFERADKALYQAKQRGRDRVETG
jgi:diguanylate cyclase (GGDEF)-like protein